VLVANFYLGSISNLLSVPVLSQSCAVTGYKLINKQSM